MIVVPCPACIGGSHEGHVEHWGKRPEGIIDGEFCYCSGDCAERAQENTDRMFVTPNQERESDYLLNVAHYANCEGEGCECAYTAWLEVEPPLPLRLRNQDRGQHNMSNLE